MKRITLIRIRTILFVTATLLSGGLTISLAQSKALFVVAGQSNAVGQGQADSSVRVPAGVAFEYRYQHDTLVPLADPVGENALAFQPARTGSAWPAFGERYHQLTGQQVIIIPAARGGSSCHVNAEMADYGTWSADGRKPLLANAVQKINRAQQHEKQSVSGIIWLQGERDANAIFDGKLTAQAYEAALISVIQRFREALGATIPFYIVLTGNQIGRAPTGNDVVRMAQLRVARQLTNVSIVYADANQFPAKRWMKDFVHYNQDALNDIGRTVAERIAATPK
ncbi:sialate O-acetylesterase [Spirosoma sp. KUDC1026]|uniref:sialate O-acetylesterase n=1 Tax=Spirosoma sp. KUDC1026 TaxID=2745947 RepID=UPI00159BA7FB|nr:sialate O-acetylesterase [Spirosoma sp. KUDC1026]QKZ14224.1 hypothetical protein HU175_16950 [Spirosoma sp. KUDC1026]